MKTFLYQPDRFEMMTAPEFSANCGGMTVKRTRPPMGGKCNKFFTYIADAKTGMFLGMARKVCLVPVSK